MSRPVCYPPGAPAARAASGLDAEQARLAAQRCLATQTCVYCEVCQLMCPDMCITRDPATGQIRVDLDHCKGCGLCAHFCPKGALEMEVEQGS
jgi:2-oxoacid:acceptor oxidoreductase delta subunit (pyruvate/2-ketoisovalerate family)